MDYEKKYKEALDRARIYRDNAKAVEEYSAVARYENIFPELREKPLTSFQQCLNSILLKVYYASVPGKVDKFILDIIKNRTDELVELAKRHEYTNGQLPESKNERIRQQLLWLCDEWEHNPERRTVPADIGNIKQIRRYLEKQKESLHVQEICKENADSFTSEDEKIRKEIIDFLETIPASELKRIPRPINEWFAWIEKQKKSHIPWYDYQKSKEAGYTIVPNEEYEQLIKQKEHKPVECSEVELEFRGEKVTVKRPFYRDDKGRGYSTTEQDEEVAWNALRAWCEKKGISLYDLYPKAEWSEDDEEMLNSCISSIEESKENRYAYKETDGDTSYDREVDWLKSLRPSWKPSEEQMKGLKFFLDFHRPQRNAGTTNWREYDAVESLYEQLKKL